MIATTTTIAVTAIGRASPRSSTSALLSTLRAASFLPARQPIGSSARTPTFLPLRARDGTFANRVRTPRIHLAHRSDPQQRADVSPQAGRAAQAGDRGDPEGEPERGEV